MDCGADGVMVPMISTEEEAQALVEWARYAPVGNRGLGSACVFTGFAAVGQDVPAFMADQNEQTLAIAQIETKEAIENIDAIAAVNGIDVLLIGPNDLSISLGVPGAVMGEAVQVAIDKVVAAAKNNNKVFAMHSGDALLDKWIPRGMQMVMNSLDITVLKTGFSAIAAKYKK
jgi:2-keto-3-deoxy-L-rhamnonate aldolase RhmA